MLQTVRLIMSTQWFDTKCYVPCVVFHIRLTPLILFLTLVVPISPAVIVRIGMMILLLHNWSLCIILLIKSFIISMSRSIKQWSGFLLPHIAFIKWRSRIIMHWSMTLHMPLRPWLRWWRTTPVIIFWFWMIARTWISYASMWRRRTSTSIWSWKKGRPGAEFSSRVFMRRISLRSSCPRFFNCCRDISFLWLNHRFHWSRCSNIFFIVFIRFVCGALLLSK